MPGFEKQKYTVFEGERLLLEETLRGYLVSIGSHCKASEGDKNGEIGIHTHKQIKPFSCRSHTIEM